MTAAFQFNLTALSLLALLVGIFLIYNAMTFSVVQRRSLFGTLRSIGYTREQVFGMVLGEAALVGVLGAGLGLGLGILLGQGAVQMVTQTINDLFFVVSVRGMQIPASSLLKGGLAGFFASVLAAAPPAWEAASVPPRLALSRAGLESKAQSAVKPGGGAGHFCRAARRCHSRHPHTEPGHQFRRHIRRDHRAGCAHPCGDSHTHAPAGGAAWQSIWSPRPPCSTQRYPLTKPHRGGCRGAHDRGLGHDRRAGDDLPVSAPRFTIWLEQTLRGDIYISDARLKRNALQIRRLTLR